MPCARDDLTTCSPSGRVAGGVSTQLVSSLLPHDVAATGEVRGRVRLSVADDECKRGDKRAALTEAEPPDCRLSLAAAAPLLPHSLSRPHKRHSRAVRVALHQSYTITATAAALVDRLAHSQLQSALTATLPLPGATLTSW